MTADEKSGTTTDRESAQASRTRGGGVAVRAVAYGVMLAAALGSAYWFTRGDAAPAAAAGGHDHSAMVPTGDAPQPVSLDAEQSRRIGLTYAAATVGPLGKEVRTVGQITFDETRVRAISPKVEGWVERLYVNATGQPVSAGDPLMAIYSPMLVQAQEELLLARGLQREMTSASGEAQGGTTSLLEAARRRLAYWDISEREIAEIERSGEVRRTLTLYSPATGYVLEKNLVPGQRVMAGEALYRVADLRTVWVEGEVFEQDLADVRVGQMVHADLPALPSEHRMGKISYIYPTLSPDTRTARVRVILPNGDLRLKPGMYATLRIVGDERERVLTVPRDAVLSTGERSVVFVREANGQLTPREVATGGSTHERVEILRGLAAGDTVVASATFLVDAESNLGKALGGMGEMPGMDMTTPLKPLPMQETGSKAVPGSPAPPKGAPKAKAAHEHDEHGGHQMPQE